MFTKEKPEPDVNFIWIKKRKRKEKLKSEIQKRPGKKQMSKFLCKITTNSESRSKTGWKPVESVMKNGETDIHLYSTAGTTGSLTSTHKSHTDTQVTSVEKGEKYREAVC